MPNANPTGINQPLDQHPLPSLRRKILGIDGLILPSMQRGLDILVVPPPSAGGVREVGGEIVPVVVVNESGANITAVALVYKDAAGNEATLALDATVMDGTAAQLALPAAFFLMPDDQGLFVRFLRGAGDPADNTVTAYSQWADVRGVERRVVSLITGAQVSLLPAIPQGQALEVALTPDEEVLASCYLLNYDTIAHGDDIVFTITDGVNEVPLLESLSDLATLIGGPVFGFNDPSGHHSIGWNILAEDSAVQTTTAAVIMTAFIRTNHGPVAVEQGGAF